MSNKLFTFDFNTQKGLGVILDVTANSRNEAIQKIRDMHYSLETVMNGVVVSVYIYEQDLPLDNDELWDEHYMLYEIIAGSGYGFRGARHELKDGKLILLESDPGDNLDGNDVVTEFDGLTLDQATYKIKFENTASLPGHRYDGCHACQWKVWLQKKG